jgi:hypothetical protein
MSSNQFGAQTGGLMMPGAQNIQTPPPTMSGRGPLSPWQQASETPGAVGGPAASQDPYLAGYAQDVSESVAAPQQLQQQMNQLGQAGVQYGGSGVANPAATSATQSQSGYPAYPNSFGLGDTSSTSGTGFAPAPSALSNPQLYAQQPVNATAADTAVQGFNPWSMTGEANSRF